MNCPVLKCRHNDHMECSISNFVELDSNAQCKYYIGPFADNDVPFKIMYLCDRRACPRCTHFECHHTKNIDHALHFVRGLDGNFTEIEDESNDA